MVWAKYPLASLCTEFTDGNWVESKDQSPQGIRLVQTGNVGQGIFKDRDDKARYVSLVTFERLKCFEIFEGDCLISRLPDPVGRSCILPSTGERMITAVDCTVARFKSNKIIPQYFNYYSLSKAYLLSVDSLTSGATRKRISRKKLGKVEVPLPPIPEQKRIVSILDQAFADIERARQLTEQNLQNARELFDSHLKKVFEITGSDDSRKQTLDSLSELIVDCEHKTAPTSEDGYPSIRTPNIQRGYLALENVYRVSEETYKLWTRRAIPLEGDLIMAREAPAGNVAVVPKGLKPCLGQRTLLIRPKKDLFIPEYLMWYLLSPNVQKRLLSTSRGATVQHVNMKDIRVLQVSNIPELSKQRVIVESIQDMLDKTMCLERIYEQKISALNELKQSILQKAFSGELTKDLEAA